VCLSTQRPVQLRRSLNSLSCLQSLTNNNNQGPLRQKASSSMSKRLYSNRHRLFNRHRPSCVHRHQFSGLRWLEVHRHRSVEYHLKEHSDFKLLECHVSSPRFLSNRCLHGYHQSYHNKRHRLNRSLSRPQPFNSSNSHQKSQTSKKRMRKKKKITMAKKAKRKRRKRPAARGPLRKPLLKATLQYDLSLLIFTSSA
jgi:hypothetical protein